MKPSTSAAAHVIIMVGIPGAGKTTFAEHFADTFKAPYINPSDISDKVGIDADTTEKVTQLLFGELLKTGRTLVYEGSTFTKDQRTAIAKFITKAGYKPLIVWVQTEPVEAKRRAASSKKKGGTMSAAEFKQAFTRFEPPTANEKPVVISGKHTYGTQTKSVLKRLAGITPDTLTPKPEQPKVQRSGRNIIIR